MTEGDGKAVPLLVFGNPLEAIGFEILERRLDRGKAQLGAPELLDQANERRKAVRVAAGAGMLEEEEDPVAAAERVEGQRSGLPSVAVDPADIAQRRGRLAGYPYLHRAKGSGRCLGAARKHPAGPDEVAGVAMGNALEIILVLGLGLPEIAGRLDLGHDLAGP